MGRGRGAPASRRRTGARDARGARRPGAWADAPARRRRGGRRAAADAGRLRTLGRSYVASGCDPAAALGTLEAAFAAEGRHDEAIVVRELRAIGGGLDDGAHAELRARRHPFDPAAPVPSVLDLATLRANVVPDGVPPLLFDLAAAIAGAASKFARVDMDALGVSPRGRLTGHPLLVYRLAKMLAIEPPDVVTSAVVTRARVVAHDTPWLVVPETLLAQPEPVQAAALVGPLVRLALGVPWIEDPAGPAGARGPVRGGAPGAAGLRVGGEGRGSPGAARRLHPAPGAGHRAKAEEGAPGAGAGSRSHAAADARGGRGLRTRCGAHGAARGVPGYRRSPGDARRRAGSRRGPRERDGQRGKGRARGGARASSGPRSGVLRPRPRDDGAEAQGRDDLGPLARRGPLALVFAFSRGCSRLARRRRRSSRATGPPASS